MHQELAGRSLELARQGGSAAARRADLGKRLGYHRVLRLILEEVGLAMNYRQDIIQVMAGPRRQLAEVFHFLCVSRSSFADQALTNVIGHDQPGWTIPVL